MKERFGRALAWVFIPLYASLGAGCFWRERGRDPDVYVERRHVEHDDHEHGDHEHHEDRHDHDRH
jgi:predicted small metal-binding protein